MRYLLLLIISVFLFQPSIAQHSQDVLKAVFSARFVQFCQWENEEKFFQNQDKFYFFSMSEKNINHDLQNTLSKISLKGKKVEFKKITNIKDATKANAIFVSDDCADCLDALLKTIEDLPILVISDVDNFADYGVHINMYITAQGTIGFELNLKAFEKSGITPNSGLIRMGKIVK